jgi:hypothetical protein
MDRDRLGGEPWALAPLGRLPGDAAATRRRSIAGENSARASLARQLLVFLLGGGAVVLVVEVAVALASLG